MRFTSYALNEQEVAVLIRELERNELHDTFDVLNPEPMKDLDAVVNEIETLIAEPKPASQQPASSDSANPFSALYSLSKLFSSEPRSDEQPDSEFASIKPDTDMEEVLRSEAILEARKFCRELYASQKRTLIPSWRR